MRFLHTADWHLGRVYHGRSLLADQAHLLDQFVKLVQQEKPDLVIIAGDVYDRSVPPADAVRLLDDTLTRIVIGEKTRVVLIAGNHDGPDRLGFGSRLLVESGLIVRGAPGTDVDPVILSDKYGEVAIYPLPFAEPALVRQLLDREDIANHNEGIAAQMDRLRAAHKPGRRSVVVAHAFVRGGTESESERDLSVGGSSQVEAEVFAGMDYVALGHLHRPQSVRETNLQYSGSLMKYSFNEVDHLKGVTLVELDGEGKVSVERIALNPLRDLRVLKGSLQELIDAGASDPGRDDYVKAELTDKGALLDAMSRLRAVYPNALSIEREQAEISSGLVGGHDHRKLNIKDLFCSFYKAMTKKELDDEALTLLAGEIAAIDQALREVQS